jgi:hypothetical protein
MPVKWWCSYSIDMKIYFARRAFISIEQRIDKPVLARRAFILLAMDPLRGTGAKRYTFFY